jgi:hypothetical protein
VLKRGKGRIGEFRRDKSGSYNYIRVEFMFEKFILSINLGDYSYRVLFFC